MSGEMINKNNDISVKVIDASATVLGGSLSAVKTMCFACAFIKIARHSSPIIGTISLVGLEIIYHKISKVIIAKIK